MPNMPQDGKRNREEVEHKLSERETKKLKEEKKL